MARAWMSLDFNGFRGLARQIDEAGEGLLKQATENALVKSAAYANGKVIEAMDKSQYSFTAGRGQSKGIARQSAEEVAKTPIEWYGTVAEIPVGVSWYDAPEVTFLSFGTPHLKPDNDLKNATRVKGPVRKEASRIQQAEFMKVLKEGMKNG